MPNDSLKIPKLPVVGFAVLLAFAIAGLWLSAGFILPSAQYVLQNQKAEVPTFFGMAFSIQATCFYAVYPITFLGILLFVGAIVHKSFGFASTCRKALAVVSGSVAVLAIYLLSSAGFAFKQASGFQMGETKYYKRILDQFALRETAENRYEKLFESLQKQSGIRMVEVGSVSEFSDAEVRERISAHIGALAQADDIPTKRRILATLALFQKNIRENSYQTQDIPRYAAEAGVPPTKSHLEALQWIASHLHKDGWEPLPLFKLVR